MRIIVQKFGGTSVATRESRRLLAARVASAVSAGYAVVVVVSALGRRGDPYATDTLISLAKDECADVAPRELDLIMSCGEVIASVVVCNAIRAAGIDATAMTGGQAGIVSDGTFGNAEIRRLDPQAIVSQLEAGKVVVVAGFQGVSESGDITTLGRGGSDTTAAALGVALQAELVEIYTDVDGVKTADPRLVPDARTIEQMTYEEVFQMAHGGAKVIHPRAVEIAMRHDVPLRVRSTFAESPGTLVARSSGDSLCPEPRHARPVTGVTHVAGLTRFTVTAGSGMLINHADTFRALANAGISVDMIAVTPASCAFVIDSDLAERAEGVLRMIGLTAETVPDCAKVSVVGVGMRGQPGVMADVSEALQLAGVEILQTVDSHMTISCLVRSADLEKAAKALHSQFGLAVDKDESRLHADALRQAGLIA